MDRRSFVTLSAGAVVSGALPGRDAPVPQASCLRFTQPRTGAGPYCTTEGKPANICLISIDMVSPDLYHPDRPLSKHVKIPNIRSLMDDGSFFSNAFCTVPLCAPSRASYLTGRYSYIQGNGERAPEGLESQLRPDDTIFPEYLRAAGYVTRQVGKCHVGSKKFLDAFGENDQPWDRWSPPVFDDDAFLAYQRRLGVKSQKYSREIVFKLQDRTTPGNSAGGWIVQEDDRPFPIEAQYSYFLARKAIETLDVLLGEGTFAGKHPVYLQLDIFDPHQPFSIPAGFEERERELRRIMTLPVSYRAVQKRNWQRDETEPEIIDIYRRYWGIYDEEQLINYRVAYVLQMEIVDKAIGMVLDRLKELKLYDQAMIALISDHGEMNGRRALVDKGVYLYPDVLRVPFIIKPPRTEASQRKIISNPVSLLDLSQTLLHAAGILPEAKFDGRSLIPYLIDGHQATDRTLLFFGGWHVGVNFACGMYYRTHQGKQFVYAYNCSSAKDELYDLDDIDASNLIDHRDHTTMLNDIVSLLGTALQADPRWIGYWAEFRIARYNTLPKTNGDMQLFIAPK